MLPRVDIEGLSKSFYNNEKELKVLDGLSLSLYEGEFVSLIGPSGCGKSTLFNIICGLENGYMGSIKIDGLDIKDSGKKFAYMYQKDLLMPWKKLMDNLMLPMEIQGIEKSAARERINELLPKFGLNGFENSYPRELSGGMRQRAALLRTFLIDSDIMLMDEPFAALDALNRDKMQSWLLSVWGQFKRSVLFITHSIDEAIFLSDRIYVLSDRPASVKLQLNIELGRPRNKDVLTSQKFMEYKELLLNSLE
jgi:ABC-type nitrate/sulfonate/bicarbonate transport system, ATPase component